MTYETEGSGGIDDHSSLHPEWLPAFSVGVRASLQFLSFGYGPLLLQPEPTGLVQEAVPTDCRRAKRKSTHHIHKNRGGWEHGQDHRGWR